MSEPRTLYQIGFINDPSSPDTLRWMIDHGVLVPVSVDDLLSYETISREMRKRGFHVSADLLMPALRAALGGTHE